MSFDANGPHILVVEDEALVRMVMVQALSALGCSSAEASSAADATEIFRGRTNDFKAAVIDLGLPDTTGDALARELRASAPRLPILIASGYHHDAIRKEFASDPHTGFLNKPYQLAEVELALRGLGVEFPCRT